MKKILSIFIIMFLLLGLSGCSNVTVGSYGSKTSTELSAHYQYFSGSDKTKLTVEEGKTVNISVDITTKEGTLDVYIYKDKEIYDYEGLDVLTSTFTVTLSEPGEYTIKVKGKKHKGSYSFTW